MLKLKLIVAWTVICLALAAGAYYLVNRSTVDLESRLVRQRVETRVEAIRMEMEVRAAGWLELAADVARHSPLSDALRNNGMGNGHARIQQLHNTVWPLMEGLNLKLGADLFWVVDANGDVIARLSDRNAFGDGVDGLPTVSLALKGVMADARVLLDNRLMVLVAVPLVDVRRSEILGVLVTGYDLDAEWLKALAQRNGLEWGLLLRQKHYAQSGAQPQAVVLAEAISGLNIEPDKIAAASAGFGDADFALAAWRLGGDLAGFNVSLYAFAPLPAPYLTLEDERVDWIVLGLLAAILLGIMVAWAMSLSLKRRAARQARTVLDMRRTGTLVASVDPKLFIAEHRPFVDLLNSVLAEMDTRKTNRGPLANAVMQTLDEVTGQKSEPKPAPESQKPDGDDPARRRLTRKEKEALDKRGEQDVIDELEGLIKSGRTNELEAAGSPAPTDGMRPAARPMGETLEMEAVTDAPDDAPQPAPAVAKKSAKGDERRAATVAKVRAIPDDESVYFEEVFAEFLNMRDMLGQPTHNVNKEKFISNLEANTKRIRQKHKCAKVRFTVFEKDGKASIKAAPAN